MGQASRISVADALVSKDLKRFPWPGEGRTYSHETPWLAIVNARGPWPMWQHILLILTAWSATQTPAGPSLLQPPAVLLSTRPPQKVGTDAGLAGAADSFAPDSLHSGLGLQPEVAVALRGGFMRSNREPAGCPPQPEGPGNGSGGSRTRAPGGAVSLPLPPLLSGARLFMPRYRRRQAGCVAWPVCPAAFEEGG